MKKAWVYKITSPTGRVYVGSSTNIKNRISKYKHHKCPQQQKLYASLIKYGFDKHVFEIICECTSDEMFAKESYYGILYNALSKEYGLNLALPKHGDQYKCMSEETLKRKSELIKGKKHSAQTIVRMTGRKMSDEARKNMSIAQTGKKRSAESIEKTRVKAIGRKRPESYLIKHKARMKGIPMPAGALIAAYEKTSKKIINTETLEIFKSIAAASKHTGKYSSYLSKALNGFTPNTTPFVYLSSYKSA